MLTRVLCVNYTMYSITRKDQDMTHSITVYSAPWCGFCAAAKRYLDDKGVKYTDKNVDDDRAFAQEAVEKSGQMGIPVLDIDGHIVVGFDRHAIDTLLAA